MKAGGHGWSVALASFVFPAVYELGGRLQPSAPGYSPKGAWAMEMGSVWPSAVKSFA
jgi:hypothetical protein